MQIRYVNIADHGDERGSLIVFEQYKNVPFDIKRTYCVYGTKLGVRRGFHAHKELNQIAIVLHGSCSFLLDDGVTRKNVELNSPTQGLFIDPMIWHEMFDFTHDCVLLMLASEVYDESDYIRNYDEFSASVNCNK